MKSCIINSSRECSNCGECNICDLNREKICDNCGVCLQLDGIDIKAVKIDELHKKNFGHNLSKVTENKFNAKNIRLSSPNEHFNITLEEVKGGGDTILDTNIDKLESNDDIWEYIDDVENLSEILNDSMLSQTYTHEAFPGLLIYNNKSRE
ncbi:MAG: hypothetical protein RSB70_00620 [Clostridium sp.]